MGSKEESLISADLSFSCSLGQILAWAYTRKSRDVPISNRRERPSSGRRKDLPDKHSSQAGTRYRIYPMGTNDGKT